MRATTENDAIPITLYRPNNDFKTPGECLPEDVQLSTAATTAQGVGREPDDRIHLHPLSQHLPRRLPCQLCLLWQGARHREEARDYADRNLIRVDWPAVHHEEIIARVKNNEGNKQFERMCISKNQPSRFQ